MFVEDRSQFFNDFAIQVLWKGTIAVDAIFDNATMVVETGGVPIEMLKPILTLDANKVLGIKQGDKFTANNKHYLVENLADDGTGMLTVELSEE